MKLLEIPSSMVNCRIQVKQRLLNKLENCSNGRCSILWHLFYSHGCFEKCRLNGHLLDTWNPPPPKKSQKNYLVSFSLTSITSLLLYVSAHTLCTIKVCLQAYKNTNPSQIYFMLSVYKRYLELAVCLCN